MHRHRFCVVQDGDLFNSLVSWDENEFKIELHLPHFVPTFIMSIVAYDNVVTVTGTNLENWSSLNHRRRVTRKTFEHKFTLPQWFDAAEYYTEFFPGGVVIITIPKIVTGTVPVMVPVIPPVELPRPSRYDQDGAIAIQNGMERGFCTVMVIYVISFFSLVLAFYQFMLLASLK